MAAEDAETLAEQNEGMVSALDMLLEIGRDNNEVKNVIKNINGFGIEGETNEGLNCNTSYSGHDLIIQSEMIETKVAIDAIFGPSDVDVFCKNAKKGGGFDNEESLDWEYVTQRDTSRNDDKVISGLDFSENDLEKKVDKNEISQVEILNDKYLGKYGGVEVKDVFNVVDQEYDYSIGDFVWSKFNSHPWWPAQIYDPSDASHHAKKCIQRGKPFLVAYFGDGSFSWRSSSQLKPFAENFDELSKQSDSVIFLTAVRSALDEIGRLAELKMTCHCISEEKKAGFIRKAVLNVGIKEGVTGPECDFSRFPVSDFETLKLFSNLRNIAVGNSGLSMLCMTGLRSCLSAYYYARGGHKLSFYHEGVMIDGMERYGLSSGKDGFLLQKCATGKRKSVAKLREENTIAKTNREKEMKSNCKSPPRNEVLCSENGSDEDEEKSLNEIAGDNFEEENGQMTASRKRKKSRYLCYPYTNTTMSVKGSKRDLIAKSLKISKIEHVRERITSAVSKLSQSLPSLEKKLIGKSDNGGDSSVLSDPGPQGDAQKKMVEPDKVKASPEEVITKARSAALDPQSLLGSDSCDMVNDFIHAYRSVVFVKGSTYKPLGKERKSLSSKPELGTKDRNETYDEMITISDLKCVRKKKIIDEVTNNEGLLLVKQKLEKVIKIVENSDGDMSPWVKLRLETEMQGILEKISTMLDIGSS